MTDIEQRAIDWTVGDDTGSSSKAMWAVMMGRKSDGGHPHDPQDFGRCHRLLEAVPEWRARLPEMAAVSPYWAALVARWPEITAAYLEQEVTQKKRRGPPYTAHALMRSILDPITDKDPRVIRLGPNARISRT